MSLKIRLGYEGHPSFNSCVSLTRMMPAVDSKKLGFFFPAETWYLIRIVFSSSVKEDV